ncbi:MAG: nuclear transport factor 2 family protein [Deltaproteobacteria bacterium]|nr:nuclear transport factor 2 family protein [Deltaproteobacteria bacterium]
MMRRGKSIVYRSIVGLQLTILAFIIAGCSGNADDLTTQQQNIAVVRSYFTALDNNTPAAIPILFAADATQEFVGNPTIVGGDAILQQFQLAWAQMQSMHTEYLTTVAEGDTVVVQVRHDAVFKAGGAVKTRTGVTPPFVVFAADTPITWRALAVFKLRDGKIIEETIIRDELAIMMQIGAVTITP